MYNSEAKISQRFEKAILLHIIKNFHPSNRYVPLMLGIHGPSGEGKTYQCDQILKKHGIKTFFISGGQLESPEAGRPAQIIRRQYLLAGKEVKENANTPSVLVINDIDAGIGNWGSLVQTTINTQNVYAELMNLVDEPTKVENIDTPRIPIIITGNDFSKLYIPLVRAGRMTSFEWMPTNEERIEILEGIFPEFQNSELETFFNELNNKVSKEVRSYLSTAFYSQLRSTLYDEMLWNFAKDDTSKILANLINGKEIKFPVLNLSVEELVNKAFDLANTGSFSNHLKN